MFITNETVDVVNNIKELFHDTQVYSFIRASNLEFDQIQDRDEFIRQRDEDWQSFPDDKISPFMNEIIQNKFSQTLRQRIQYLTVQQDYSLVGEIFVTNKYGVNIIQSRKTSDYNQSDETWWQQTKDMGFFVDEPKYDESSGIEAIAFGVRLDDSNGDFLGVMKLLINKRMFSTLLTMAKEYFESGIIDFVLLTDLNNVVYSTNPDMNIIDICMHLASERDSSCISNDKTIHYSNII